MASSTNDKRISYFKYYCNKFRVITFSVKRDLYSFCLKELLNLCHAITALKGNQCFLFRCKIIMNSCKGRLLNKHIHLIKHSVLLITITFEESCEDVENLNYNLPRQKELSLKKKV